MSPLLSSDHRVGFESGANGKQVIKRAAGDGMESRVTHCNDCNRVRKPPHSACSAARPRRRRAPRGSRAPCSRSAPGPRSTSPELKTVGAPELPSIAGLMTRLSSSIRPARSSAPLAPPPPSSSRRSMPSSRLSVSSASGEIDLGRAGEDVGDAVAAQAGQMRVGHRLGQDDEDRIAADVLARPHRLALAHRGRCPTPWRRAARTSARAEKPGRSADTAAPCPWRIPAP